MLNSTITGERERTRKLKQVVPIKTLSLERKTIPHRDFSAVSKEDTTTLEAGEVGEAVEVDRCSLPLNLLSNTSSNMSYHIVTDPFS